MGHHFYTTDTSEVTRAIANDGRVLEGVACYVFSVPSFPPQPPFVPLYRLYNSSSDDHLYTIDPNEVDRAKTQNGYQSEGIACVIYDPSAVPAGTVPLYRLYNSSLDEHFYTANQDELARVLGNGFQLDTQDGRGITGYVYDLDYTSVPEGTLPFYRLYKN